MYTKNPMISQLKPLGLFPSLWDGWNDVFPFLQVSKATEFYIYPPEVYQQKHLKSYRNSHIGTDHRQPTTIFQGLLLLNLGGCISFRCIHIFFLVGSNVTRTQMVHNSSSSSSQHITWTVPGAVGCLMWLWWYFRGCLFSNFQLAASVARSSVLGHCFFGQICGLDFVAVKDTYIYIYNIYIYIYIYMGLNPPLFWHFRHSNWPPLSPSGLLEIGKSIQTSVNLWDSLVLIKDHALEIDKTS